MAATGADVALHLRFVWTTLHNFGGNDGIAGDLGILNDIPWAALAPDTPTSVWGTGFTPEGIDQNPLYYDFMQVSVCPPPLFPGAAGAGPLDYKTCSSFASTMFRRLTAIVSLMAGARPVNTRETFHRSHALWFKTRLRIRVLHVALKRCAAGQCFCAALPKIRTPTPPKELVCHSLYGAM